MTNIKSVTNMILNANLSNVTINLMMISRDRLMFKTEGIRNSVVGATIVGHHVTAPNERGQLYVSVFKMLTKITCPALPMDEDDKLRVIYRIGKRSRNELCGYGRAN